MEFNEQEVGLMEKTFVIAGVILAILFSLFSLTLLLWPDAAFAADAPAHKYIGVEKCGMCHKSDAKGNQLKQWQASKHSKAYVTLATKEAKEVAEKAGVKGDPQKAEECLKCHTTGHGAAASLFDAKFKKEDGVQCEVCHGAGADYAKVPIMKDRKKSIENGMTVPDEKTCVKCHNENSPGFKGFDYKEMKKKVEHPRPKAAAPAAK